MRGEAFPPPAGVCRDVRRCSRFLCGCFPVAIVPLRTHKGNSVRGRGRVRRDASSSAGGGGAFARRSVPAAGRACPWTPLPAAAPHLRQGDVCRARGGPCDRGRRRRVGLRRLPERFAGKSFGGPAQRRRYISSRNSALRSSTFVSRGFPGRQASA